MINMYLIGNNNKVSYILLKILNYEACLGNKEN